MLEREQKSWNKEVRGREKRSRKTVLFKPLNKFTFGGMCIHTDKPRSV